MFSATLREGPPSVRARVFPHFSLTLSWPTITRPRGVAYQQSPLGPPGVAAARALSPKPWISYLDLFASMPESMCSVFPLFYLF